jgi:hypothetical protein
MSILPHTHNTFESPNILLYKLHKTIEQEGLGHDDRNFSISASLIF